MRIHVLDLDFQHVGQSVAAFVAEGPEGLALIECGPASTLPALDAALQDLGAKKSDFRHLFLSHIHFDHAGAAWAFAQAGARVYVHPKGLPHLAAPEKLYNSAKMIYGEDMDRLWGPMHPIAEEQLYAPAHGESILVGGLRFTAWHTPGHAVHHIAWQLEPESGDASPLLFTGDVAGVKIGEGPVAPPCPPPDIHLESWLESIQLMRDLPVESLYLTHFGLIHNKLAHLDDLEAELHAWANWMKPYAIEGTDPALITPLFRNFVDDRYEKAGLGTAARQRYETANPAFMSVAGLLRYWKKVLYRPA